MSLLKTAAPEIELVIVPAGEFTMGQDGGMREDPAHSVTLAEYQIGRYPITNAQYLPFVQDTGHPPPATWRDDTFPVGEADHPVSGVTWADAWLYCAWLRYKTGQPYHLPTEAQWEKAATWNPSRGRKQPYPWGDKPDARLCNLSSSGHEGTTPVGSFSPQGDSPYGCADMIGNVDEWCNTVMWEYTYQAHDGREELWASGRRCIRGGDWRAILTQSGIRRDAPSDWWVYVWGVRVALSSALNDAHQRFMRQFDKMVPEVRAQFATEMEKNPESAQVYYDRGTWLLNLTRYSIDYAKESEKSLTQALELVKKASPKPFWRRFKTVLDSPLSHMYFNRAAVRRQLKDYEGALADISRAIDLDKSDADAFMMRAGIACELGRWAGAEKDLGTALKLKPKHHEELRIRARIRKGQGAWQAAIDLIADLIKKHLFTPLWCPEVYLWRAEAYERLGRPHKAISDCYHYLLWRPEAPEADEIARKMQEYLNRS